jgi:hypothetical protein
MTSTPSEAILDGQRAPRTRRALLGWLAGLTGGALAGLIAVVHAEPGERKRTRKRQRRRSRQRKRQADRALYPDLKALPPLSGLRFDVLDDGTHVLRFTSTIWNDGEGPLELQAPTSPQSGESGQLYQNLYDAPVGGQRVSRRRVAGRISYHETHSHFHFNDFASYELLRRDPGGEYLTIGEGTKTSFCILDSSLMPGPANRYPRGFTECEQTRQGLTPGWGDTYAANLPDQWVVVGAAPLPDGDYALRVIADSRGLLAEGGGEREQNNTAIGYFAVTNGVIGPVSSVLGPR